MGKVTVKELRDTFEGLNEFDFITYIGIMAVHEYGLTDVVENWPEIEKVIKETIREIGLENLKEKIIQIYESKINEKSEDN